MLLHMRQCPKKWCKLGTVEGKFVIVSKTYVDLARKRPDWAILGTIEKSVGLVPNLGARKGGLGARKGVLGAREEVLDARKEVLGAEVRSVSEWRSRRKLRKIRKLT